MNLEEKSISELVVIHNQYADKPVKKFSDKKSALRRTAAVLPAEEPKPKPETKPRSDSKSARIRRVFERVNEITIDDLIKEIDYDRKNTLVLVSILANPKRNKNPLNIKYDRATKMVRVQAS